MLQLGRVAVEISRLVEEQRVGVAAPGRGVRRRDAMYHVPQVQAEGGFFGFLKIVINNCYGIGNNV